MHTTLRIKSPPGGRFAHFLLAPRGEERPQTDSGSPLKTIAWWLGAALWAAIVLVAATVASARIEGEAVLGEPFGVGRITLSAADIGGPIDPAFAGIGPRRRGSAARDSPRPTRAAEGWPAPGRYPPQEPGAHGFARKPKSAPSTTFSLAQLWKGRQRGLQRARGASSAPRLQDGSGIEV